MASEDLLNPEAVAGHNKPPLGEVMADRYGDLLTRLQAIRDEASAWPIEDKHLVPIKEAAEAAKLQRLAISARDMKNELEKTKLATTKPLRDAVDEINAYFTGLKDRAILIFDLFSGHVAVWNEEQREIARRAAAAEAARQAEEAQRRLEAAAVARTEVEQEVMLESAAEAEEKAKVAAFTALQAGTRPVRTDGGTISTVKNWDFQVTDWSKLDLRQLRDSFSVAEIEKAIRAHVRKHKDRKQLAGVRIFQGERTQLRG